MRFSIVGTVVKYDPKYKNCTIDFDGSWFPCFVPEKLSQSLIVGEECKIDFSVKCKFEKGKKPYLYLILKEVDYGR